jgi:hypothetical protein
MFDQLDASLGLLLNDSAIAPAFPELFNADIAFTTPEKAYKYTQETLNLFLYETRENRELRRADPIVEYRNGLSARRRPPLRVDCSYMVTAWSKKNLPDKVAAEHKLLGQAFACLSRFPVLPDRFLVAPGLMAEDYPPPTLVAQMDAAKNVGEFWSALGIAPRPFFNLIVTITMDLDQSLQEFPVTTMLTTYEVPNTSLSELRVNIGGTVRGMRNLTLVPIPDAWVRLEPSGLTTVSDRAGRFIFDNVSGGPGMTLRARAMGFNAEAQRVNFEIPSLDGTYDLQFP